MVGALRKKMNLKSKKRLLETKMLVQRTEKGTAIPAVTVAMIQTAVVCNYTECPQGRPCLGMGRVSFFSFVVVTNRQINLCIKICPPLVGMYCSDCLQQKRPNQNLLFRHISRDRGPIHPFVCDVKSSFDLFIKPSLNSALSQKGFIVLIVLNKTANQNPLSARISRGRGPTHLYRVTSNKHHLEGCFRSMAATCMN